MSRLCREILTRAAASTNATAGSNENLTRKLWRSDNTRKNGATFKANFTL